MLFDKQAPQVKLPVYLFEEDYSVLYTYIAYDTKLSCRNITFSLILQYNSKNFCTLYLSKLQLHSWTMVLPWSIYYNDITWN